MALELDHLVLAARSLDEGEAWCAATLGIRAAAGGQHPTMGTHNRVFSIASAAFPRAYFEIIAIDPGAAPPRRPRWFDLDDPALQRALERGPQLVHWLARCERIDETRAALRALGVDVGEVQHAERGTLRWRISVRADGGRAFGGAAPALIEWAGAHPTDTLPPSAVTLQAMRVGGGLPAAAAALMAPPIDHDAAPHSAPIAVVLASPRGPITIEAWR